MCESFWTLNGSSVFSSKLNGGIERESEKHWDKLHSISASARHCLGLYFTSVFFYFLIRTSSVSRLNFLPSPLLMLKSDTFIPNWAPLKAYLSLCSCSHTSAQFKTTFSSWVMASYSFWSRGQHSLRPAFPLYPSIKMASGNYKHDSSTYTNTHMKYTLNKRLLNIIWLRGTRIWTQINDLWNKVQINDL